MSILDFTAWSGLYRLVCKVVNFWDIDLLFLGSVSNVKIDNCAKSIILLCLEHTFLETCYLSISKLCWPIVYRHYEFCLFTSSWSSTSGKNVMVIYPVQQTPIPNPHLVWVQETHKHTKMNSMVYLGGLKEVYHSKKFSIPPIFFWAHLPPAAMLQEQEWQRLILEWSKNFLSFVWISHNAFTLNLFLYMKHATKNSIIHDTVTPESTQKWSFNRI